MSKRAQRIGGGRPGERHAVLGNDNVYCEWQGAAAPPVVTHSAVKCSFCKKTLAGLRYVGGAAGNPLDRNTMNVFLSTLAETPEGSPSSIFYLGMQQAGWTLADYQQAVEFGIANGLVKKIGDVIYPTEKLVNALRKLKGNPSRAHIRADIAAFGRVTREMKRLTARDRREIRRNPSHRPPWAVVDWGRKELQEGGLVRRFSAVRNTSDLYTDRSRAWGGKIEVIATFEKLSDAEKFADTMDFRHRGRRQNPVPSYAMILRRKLAKGHTQDEAEELARRELQQASELLSRPRKNPAHGNGPVKIYGQTEKIFMKKTSGPYKGQRFVHDFKRGVEQIGFPRGTVLQAPDGRNFRMTTRCVVLSGKKDLWRKFAA